MAAVNGDEDVLAGLGYKQEFKREFGLVHLFGLIFSNIGLFPSIVSVLSIALGNGGAAALVWGWVSGCFFIFFVALAVAELGSAAPTSGGLYYWTFAYASPRTRRLLCWIVGYANTVSNISSVASVDWSCASQISSAIVIGSNGNYVPSTGVTYGIFAAVVLSHIVLCSSATRVLAHLQAALIAVNILLALAVIIVLPATTPKEYMNTASYAFGNFSNVSGWTNGFAFLLSTLSAHWTMGGLDGAVHISEEASNAPVAVPHAIVGAVFVAAILGTAINIAISFCMGTDLAALLGSDVGQPMAVIFVRSLGRRGTLAIWSFVIIALYFCGSSLLLAASRQAFAFSRDGALPGSSWLYHIHPRTQTPVRAVVFAATGTLLLCLLSFAGPQAINAVFSLIVASYVSIALPIVCRFAFANDFRPGPFYLGRASLPVAIIAVGWMTFISIVFLFPTSPGPRVGDMNYTVVVLGGVLLLSVLYYYAPAPYGGVHWFTGPKVTVELTGARLGTADVEAPSSGEKTPSTAEASEIERVKQPS